MRERIQAQLRSLRNTTFRAAADNFRLSELESRFNTYNEQFNRRLRDREEGRRGPRHAPAPAAPPRYDAERGIVMDDGPEPAAVAALYAGLGGGGKAVFDLAGFEAYLARQAAAIRAKTGCAAVQFRIAVEDGKPRLKARPITD